MEGKQTDAVCAVVVTYNRKALLRGCLQAILAQTRSADQVVVVDNAGTDGTEAMVHEEFPTVSYLRLDSNQGGAGGFHEGMKWAYESGFDWVWVMDDDGHPAEDCLEHLLHTVTTLGVDAAGPLVVDHENPSLLSFGLVAGAKLARSKEEIIKFAPDGVLHGQANFFNGILFSKRVIEAAGLPMKDLFIRGDEVEYLLRITTSGIKVVTDTRGLLKHPSGMSSQQALFLGRFFVVHTGNRIKDYFFFRNRAYIHSSYRRKWGLILDCARYSYYFLIKRKVDLQGFKLWVSATQDGVRKDFAKGRALLEG